LQHRIEERFPRAGLARVAGELLQVAESARQNSARISQPVLPLRFAIAFLIILIVAGLLISIIQLEVPGESITLPDFVQTLEAGINDVVLIGIGIFFLMSLERRHKRRLVLRALHELRSIAHIVDMHQLTKDPGHTLHAFSDTPSSPRRTLSKPLLVRYLDYCAEMLSLTGKIAAMYVERFDDSVVLASVNEIEAMATSMAGKIWQKLMILELTGPAKAGTVQAFEQLERPATMEE
jgi:hypothetical protein